ncbi:phosphatase PAP2 family protein [Oerskovia flava]|uniref:phosphatase PAP2 family protein n=1 Tax=Oerskovia flava TaxID=2986422 RepID=UPI00223FE702|nr:phosphatase PAP2 family protein [Oerskovia sp. JB1-3-2]
MSHEHVAPTQPLPRSGGQQPGRSHQRPPDGPPAFPDHAPGHPAAHAPAHFPAHGRAAPTGTSPGAGPSVVARVVAVLTALVAAVGVWVLWRYFADTFEGQQLERLAFDGAVYGQGRLWQLAEPVLDVVSVTFLVAGVGAAMLIALLRRRWGLALQVAFLVVGANVTTQLVKHSLLGRENLIGGWDSGNTLPSGHTTVAASVSAALLLAVPRPARPLVAVLGAGYTAATGVSTLVGQWHRPSDVVAAVLVVLAWGAMVCAFTPSSALDVDAGSAPGSAIVGVLLLLGAAASGAVAVWSLQRVYPASWSSPDADQVTAYLGGAAGVVAVSAAAFALLLLLRQATGRAATR